MLSKFESLIEGGNASFLKERTNIFSDFYSKKITFGEMASVVMDMKHIIVERWQ